jgi:uncharacterized membrane protein
VGIWDDFWGVLWTIFWVFAFFAYLMAMFSVIGDLFRDHKLNGWLKAIWVLFLVFVPFLTVLVYLIARGRGMNERQAKLLNKVQEAQESYIKQVAGTSAADQISQAKSLLDSGAISADEFAVLKGKALA